jgi:TonB family protein
VWSLGVTLVEVLTQRVPNLAETGTQVANRLPDPFRKIVQHSLVREPDARWKTSEIREYLTAPVSAVASPETAVRKPVAAPVHAATAQQASSSSKYVIPAAIVAILAGGIFVVPHLLKHTPETQVPAAVTAAAPGENATEAKPVSPTESRKSALQKDVHSAASASSNESARATQRPVESRAAVGSEDGVLSQPVPDVPRHALNTITGKVRVKVKVHVDREGKVVDSEFASHGPSQYFARLAMETARQWKFAPSDSESRAWNLQFDFRRTGTDVVPTQLDR